MAITSTVQKATGDGNTIYTVAGFSGGPVNVSKSNLQQDLINLAIALINSVSGGGAPTGPAGGDLGGTYPNPTVLRMQDGAGHIVIGGANQTMFDTSGAFSLDWNNRELEVGAVVVLNWNLQQLIDSSGTESISWGNRQLFDSFDVGSVEWDSRVLQDTVQSNSVDWANRFLSDNNSFTSVDWQNGILTFSGVDSIHWANRILLDSGSVGAIDWQTKILVDAFGVESLDWDGRSLLDTSGIPISGIILQNGGAWIALTLGTNLSLDTGTGTLNATGGAVPNVQRFTPVNLGTTTIAASGGSNITAFLNPAGTIATQTVNLPAGGFDGQTLALVTSQVIGAVTFTGAATNTNLTAFSAKTGFQFTWDSTLTEWRQLSSTP